MGGRKQVCLHAEGIAYAKALWQGESHGIQGPERRPGSLMTQEEQSIVSLMKQERYGVTRLFRVLSVMLRSFCFILRAMKAFEE